MTESENISSRTNRQFSALFTPKTLESLQRNFKPETLDRKISILSELGFHDPVGMIERFPQTAGYNMQRVMDDLTRAGFHNPRELIEKRPQIASCHMQRVMDDLTGAGFHNIVKLIEKHPPIAGYNIRRVIEGLTMAGFRNPVGLIEKFPPMSGYNIRRVIEGLTRNGFKDPIGIIEKNPSFAGRNIQQVIEGLTRNGFTEPVKLVEKFPSVANYNMQHVLQGLKEAGFVNPVKLIETFPPVAGLNINNVKRKVELIRTLNKQFGTDYDPHSVIESFPPYLNYSKSRLFFYLRVAARFELDETVYERLITKNPFLVFAYLQQTMLADRSELVKIALQIEKLSKQEKALKIAGVKASLPQIIEALKARPESEDKTFLLKLATSLVTQIK
jgi:hypothetical protein